MRILYGGSVKPSNAKELLARRQRRRRAGRRRKPEGRRISSASPRFTAEPRSGCARVEMRRGDRVETAANSYMSGSRTGPSARPADLSGFDCMQTVVIVIHLMIVLAMIGLVLLQVRRRRARHRRRRRRLHASRGTANVLTRTTAILAGLFFVTSLVLSILAGFDRKPRSILRQRRRPARRAPGAPRAAGAGRRRARPVAAANAAAPRRRRRPRRPGRRCRSRNESCRRAGEPALRI